VKRKFEKGQWIEKPIESRHHVMGLNMTKTQDFKVIDQR